MNLQGAKEFNSDGWCVYLAWSVFDGNVGEGKAFFLGHSGSAQQLRGSKRAKSNGGRSQGAALPKPLDVFFNSFAFERFPGFAPFRSNMCCENLHNLNQTTHQNSVSLLMLMGVQVPITKSKGKRDFSGATELLGSFAHLAIHAATMLGVTLAGGHHPAFHPISRVNWKRQIHSVCF